MMMVMMPMTITMLTEEEGKEGVKLARLAIAKHLDENLRLKAPDTDYLPACFEEKRGVFVTLTRYDGSLRGCIGYPYPVFALKDAIIDAAIAAAVNDPRFPPVTKAEFKDLVIELTILTVPQELKVKPAAELHKQIEIGRHGLIVKKGIYQGLLLPQVATENNWSAEEFISHTCRKAGLPEDVWQDEDVSVSIFEGQIFRLENDDTNRQI